MKQKILSSGLSVYEYIREKQKKKYLLFYISFCLVSFTLLLYFSAKKISLSIDIELM